MFIKCFTCKNPLYDHIHEICVNIFILCDDKYFYGKMLIYDYFVC